MTVSTNDQGQQNMWATEPRMYMTKEALDRYGIETHNERAEKLNALKGRVKQTYKKEEDSHRKTKLAYVDVAPKAPRSIRNAQVKHGTALPSGTPMVAGGPRPRNAMGDPTANSSRAGFTSK